MENPDTTNNAVSDEVAILVDSPGTNITAVVTPRRASSSCQDHHDGHQNDDDDEDQGVDISTASSVPSGFSCKQFITKRLPILKWLPQYNPKSDFFPDLISGVTVGLTAIPQSIAYAGVAGLTPEYGLYSSFISCFVYLFLGSCRQMTIGPTALMELLVFETCGEAFPSCVVLVGFWVGCIQFVMGLLKLGVVVSLISDPVTIGFVAGASLTICSSQIRSFLGLTGPKGNAFLSNIETAIENIGTAKLGDSMLGLGCVLILLLFKNLKDYVKPDISKPSGRYLAKFIWVLSIGRNAMVVIVASILAACLNSPPFALTGTVKSGFPPVAPPHFTLPDHFPPNNSTSPSLSFGDTWSALGSAPLMIALISILQNVAIAKAFGSGQSIDATQEMIALGVSHICASFFSALPTAGSFTRSAVNEASGVKSPIGGIFTGLLVIFALSFLTRWFAYIPKASLAAVILCAVLPMIEYENILPMWRVSKLEVITCAVTFLASLLLGMEYGIIIGVAVSLALYLLRPVKIRVQWKIMTVQGVEEENDQGVVTMRRPSREKLASGPIKYHLIKPEQGFQFPSVDALRTMINKNTLRHPDVKIVCLDCERMIAMDYTSASALSVLVKALRKTGKEMVLMNCDKEWVDMMGEVGLKKVDVFTSKQDLDKWLQQEYSEKVA